MAHFVRVEGGQGLLLTQSSVGAEFHKKRSVTHIRKT